MGEYITKLGKTKTNQRELEQMIWVGFEIRNMKENYGTQIWKGADQ